MNKEEFRKYKNKYQKEHYKRYSFDVDFELSDRIEDYCCVNEISKAKFIKDTIISYLDENEEK